MEANVSRIYIQHRLRSKRSHRNATFLHGQTYLAGTPYSPFPVRAFFRNFAQSQHGGQHQTDRQKIIPYGQGDREEIYSHQRQL